MKGYSIRRTNGMLQSAIVRPSETTGPGPDSSSKGNTSVQAVPEHAARGADVRLSSTCSVSPQKSPGGKAAVSFTGMPQPRSFRIDLVKMRQRVAGGDLTSPSKPTSSTGNSPLPRPEEGPPPLENAVIRPDHMDEFRRTHAFEQALPDSQSHNSSVMLGCLLENLALFFAARQIAIDPSLLHGGRLSMTQLASAFETYVEGLAGVDGRRGFGKHVIRKTFTHARAAYLREAGVAERTRRA